MTNINVNYNSVVYLQSGAKGNTNNISDKSYFYHRSNTAGKFIEPSKGVIDIVKILYENTTANNLGREMLEKKLKAILELHGQKIDSTVDIKTMLYKMLNLD